MTTLIPFLLIMAAHANSFDNYWIAITSTKKCEEDRAKEDKAKAYKTISLPCPQTVLLIPDSKVKEHRYLIKDLQDAFVREMADKKMKEVE